MKARTMSGLLTALMVIPPAAPLPPQTTQPATQAAVQACEQRYSSGPAYGSAPIIIDGVSDAIRWPRPATCKRLIAYLTGGNQVSDRDGENPALVGIAWRDIDAARYRIVRDAGGLALQGVHADTRNYNRWRYVVETRELCRRLARHDAERLARAGYDGAMLDNFNVCPFAEQGGSFRRMPGWEWTDHEWVRDCLAAYVLEFRMWYRLCAGRDPYLMVNVARPQVWYDGGVAAPTVVAVERMATWLTALGVDGVMVESPLRYVGDEGASVRKFLALWKSTGHDLILKQIRGTADLAALGAELAGSNVYLSVDR